ncbi:zinc-binding dehydrogenase [Streptomyces sp. NPDC004549]|uniref:zinc-binding dehydrogenase n=1 Tax=Streptomyces sp. NPDC004549 TaxID=3154283 RepID=UPI0033A0806D
MHSRCTAPCEQEFFAYEDVRFQATDGTILEGWFIPPDSDKLLIANHPMPCNRYGYPGHLPEYANPSVDFEVNFLPDYKNLHDVGYNVLAYDPGRTVLITGAEGAVGGYAVQLAKRRGAVVIASGRGAESEFATKVAGADAYVSTAQAPVEAVRAEGVDAVLDATTLGQSLIGAVKDDGTFVTARSDAVPRAERGIRVRLTQVAADAAMLTTLSDLAAAGELALRVAATYPLEEAAKAYERLAAGGLWGRVVLTMD